MTMSLRLADSHPWLCLELPAIVAAGFLLLALLAPPSFVATAQLVVDRTALERMFPAAAEGRTLDPAELARGLVTEPRVRQAVLMKSGWSGEDGSHTAAPIRHAGFASDGDRVTITVRDDRPDRAHVTAHNLARAAIAAIEVPRYRQRHTVRADLARRLARQRALVVALESTVAAADSRSAARAKPLPATLEGPARALYVASLENATRLLQRHAMPSPATGPDDGTAAETRLAEARAELDRLRGEAQIAMDATVQALGRSPRPFTLEERHDTLHTEYPQRKPLLLSGASASVSCLLLGLLVAGLQVRGERRIVRRVLSGTPVLATVAAPADGRHLLHRVRILLALLALAITAAGYAMALAEGVPLGAGFARVG